MLHVSNVYHLVYVALAVGLLHQYVHRSARRRWSTIAYVIQLALALFVVDLGIGFFVIDRVFGSTPSAGWISKAVLGWPVILVATVIYTFVSKRSSPDGR